MRRRRRIRPEDVFALSDGVRVEPDDDGVTVFDPRSGTYWRGNSSARQLVEELARPRSATAVVTALHVQYDVDTAVLTEDVHGLLRELSSAGVIQKVRA